MKKRLFIGLDLDNTILDTPKILWKLYNLRYKTNIPYIEDCGWDFKGLFKQEDLPKVFKLFDDEEFYNYVETFDNAIEVIKELAKDHKIIIASKHKLSRRPITRKWVKETFNDKVELMYFDDFNKSALGKVDVFMDDRLDALENMKDYARFNLCYGNYKWNKEWEGIRIEDWSAFRRFIDIITHNK
jgi:5'(3')-deoxyribonucleotidase